MGLFISFIILPMEYIFLHLKPIKYNIFKIIILFIIISSTLTTKQLLSSMLYNYLIYNNNIYIIISTSLFFLSLRMELFIIMIVNNIKRGKAWDYDENNTDDNNNQEQKWNIIDGNGKLKSD